MNWHLISDSNAQANWDHWLEAVGGASFHQSYRWGAVKARQGWEVLRLANDEHPTAIVQTLVRRQRFGIALAWIPGGPAGDLAQCNGNFQAALREHIGTRWVYCRTNTLRPLRTDEVALMQRNLWHKPRSPLNTGLSMLYDPSQDESARTQLATGNWRHNLKRSNKYGLQLHRWDCRDAAEIVALYQGMEQHKGLAQQVSAREVQAMLDLMGDQLILWRCDDAEGIPLALRGCAIFGNRAWDIFAAATPAARKVYASYASFWALMRDCGTRGVQQYDMGGVDPANNRGVYDFKKGSGATPVEYLGEWEWSSSPLLRVAANWMIARRSSPL